MPSTLAELEERMTFERAVFWSAYGMLASA